MDIIPDVGSMVDAAALQGAKASGGNRNYARAGDYLGIWQSAAFGKKRGNIPTPFFAAEYRILWAAPNSEMVVGEVMDYYADGAQDWYLGNIKMVIQAILGVSQEEITRQPPAEFKSTLNDLFGMAQLAAGQWSACRAVKGVTKKGPRAGQPNCIPTFRFPTDEDFTTAGLSRAST